MFHSHFKADEQELEDDSATTCSSHFKAASEYQVPERFVDNGIVAGTCRHDIALRLHNIKNTGERKLYSYRLLKSILSDLSCPEVLVIFYDINCQFSKFLKVCPFMHLRTNFRKEWQILLNCLHD